MRITHLSLTNFRNYSRLDIDIPAGPVLLVGGNAQGKTSILESIYFLATLESFLASNDRQLINFSAAKDPLGVAKIVVDFDRKEAHVPSNEKPKSHRGKLSQTVTSRRIEIRIIQETGDFNGTPRVRKEILIDGLKVKPGEALGNLNAVLFLPHMLRVVDGPPEERRRYLNLALSQVWPQYAISLLEFNRVLSQRNALLKQLSERGSDIQAAETQLSYWDEHLVTAGAQIIHFRLRAIKEIEHLATRIHSELTRQQEVLRIVYHPGFNPIPQSPNQYALPMDVTINHAGIPIDKIQEGYLSCLARSRSEEISRGVTTIGPHRDELRFLGNRIDLGSFGSRGQARTAMLSLKLAEAEWIKEKKGQWPILLFDEVLAELDPDRRNDLLGWLSESEQTLLTTTDIDAYSHNFAARATIWKVHGGRIEEQLRKE